jgi:subtilisin family serine protease
VSFGVAPQADLYAVKVLKAAVVGMYSHVIQGIVWAIDQQVDIISISFDGYEPSQALQATTQEVTRQGILVIAATGKFGTGDKRGLFPARYPEALSIGAVTYTSMGIVFEHGLEIW